MSSRLKALTTRAHRYGLHVSYQNTGEGVRIYRFHTESKDYHAGDHLTTCKGIAQAEMWLSGYACASNAERNRLLDAVGELLGVKSNDKGSNT